MISFILLVITGFVQFQIGLGDADPCAEGNFLYIFNAGVRGGSCKRIEGQEICDFYMDSGWYKVKHEDDTVARKMIEQGVNAKFCGTTYPVWLNGTHPSIGDGIVNRTACVTGRNSLCDKVYKIQIKACTTGDFVYNLQKTSACPEAYCFGQNKPCARPNPCQTGNSRILHAGNDRSTTCKDTSMKFCDDYMNGFWYRVQRNGIDLKMPSKCPKQSSCGTKFPIWLDGNEPTVDDKYVTRRACVNQGSSCQCTKSYNIEIRNCSTYLVYNLTSTSECPERYCFGDSGTCQKEENKDARSDFMIYVYGSVAAVSILLLVSGGAGYFWYKKALRLRRIENGKKEICEEKKKHSKNNA